MSPDGMSGKNTSVGAPTQAALSCHVTVCCPCRIVSPNDMNMGRLILCLDPKMLGHVQRFHNGRIDDGRGMGSDPAILRL